MAKCCIQRISLNVCLRPRRFALFSAEFDDSLEFSIVQNLLKTLWLGTCGKISTRKHILSVDDSTAFVGANAVTFDLVSKCKVTHYSFSQWVNEKSIANLSAPVQERAIRNVRRTQKRAAYRESGYYFHVRNFKKHCRRGLISAKPTVCERPTCSERCRVPVALVLVCSE